MMSFCFLTPWKAAGDDEAALAAIHAQLLAPAYAPCALPGSVAGRSP